MLNWEWMQVSIEKVLNCIERQILRQIVSTTALRHWVWKKPIVQHCNMVHDMMVMIWKVQWCSWINQNESFNIISKLQNERKKQNVLYFKFGLLGSVFAFLLLSCRKPQCLGMHLWTVRRVRNAEDNTYLAFVKLQKGQLYALLFGHKKRPTFKHVGRNMVFFNPQSSLTVTWQLFLSSHILWNGKAKEEGGKEGGRNHRKRT